MAEDTSLFSQASDLDEMKKSLGLQSAPQAPSVQDGYQPIFKYSGPDQLDADITGGHTEEYGKATGKQYNRGTILELQLNGKVYSADQLRQVEGGAELIDSALRRRTSERRGFLEALGTGPATDFIPYAGDIAATGVAIRNMKTVRDSLEKMSREGVSALSLKEQVMVRLYSEEMERSANASFGGKVGSILRTAPAFALEFMTTGGLFKAGAKALGIAAKDVGKEAVESSAKKAISEIVFREMKRPGAAKEALKLENLGFREVAEKIASSQVARDAVTDPARKDLLRVAAEKTAEAYVAAYRNPRMLKNFSDFMVEYGKRGFFDHMDDVVRDLPPSVMGKLREAAGVAFVEAPIKGALYASFDFLAANPAIAAVTGADEAVTKQELGYALTGREDLMRNAKLLAFGSAVAEYASETSGRAFTALGGMVAENVAGEAGRVLARRGLRAVASKDRDTGSFVAKLLEATYGTDEQLKAALSASRTAAVEGALAGGRLASEGIGSVSEAMAKPGLAQQLMREKLNFQEKSFLGYWVAQKSIDKGITPLAVTRMLESMGYDDILGEFMEERYSDFAEGLFGLDGRPDKGFMANLAHAAKASVPDIEQGAAELVAFAVPVAGRAAISKAYGVLGTGTLGSSQEAMRILGELSAIGGWTHEEASGLVTRDVRQSDEASGSLLAESRAKWGKENVKEKDAWMRSRLSEAAERLADIAPRITSIVEGKTGVPTAVARSALKIAEFMITGNPFVAFKDPVRAMAEQTFGNGGVPLLNALSAVHKGLYNRQLAVSTGKTAEEIEAGRAGKIGESVFEDPAILSAIRPQMVRAATKLSQIVLAARGSLVTTDEDIEAHLDTLFKPGTETLGGKTRAEFKREFRGELAEAVAGNVTINVDHGRVGFFYNRKNDGSGTPVGEVAKQVELFLNKSGVSSFIDGAAVGDILGSMTGTAKEMMDLGRMETAAGTNGASPDDIQKARFELLLQAFTGVNLSNPAALENAMEKAGDYARTFLAVNRTLLRPSFELSGRRISVSGDAGAFSLEYMQEPGRPKEKASDAGFATLQEAEAEAVRLGASRQPAQIFFTPGQAFYAPHAAMLVAAPGASNYMAADPEYAGAVGSNPYQQRVIEGGESFEKVRAEVTAEIALAKRWLEKVSRPFATADEEAAARAAYERALSPTGYETLAAKAAEAQRIRRLQKPDARGETGFLFVPGALAYGGSVYVPIKWLGSSAPLIEDAFETAIKRSPDIFRNPEDRGSYRPAAKEFMQVVYNHLTALRESGETERIRSDANYLTGMFNPDVYNLDAVSHAITAFVAMQGDAAVSGSANVGAAYYDTLGKIAKQVRADPFYDGFVSLVNRLTGSGALSDKPESGASLASLVAGIVPKKFLDSTDSLRTVTEGVVKETPVSDIYRAGRSVKAAIDVAMAGIPRSVFMSKGAGEIKNERARYAAEVKRLTQSLERGGDVFLEEDIPAVLERMKGYRGEQMKALSADVVLAEEAANPDTARERLDAMIAERREAKAREAARLADHAPDSDVTASMSEDTLVSRPAVAVLIAREWIKARVALSGDRNPRIDLDTVFDEWRAHDPILREAVRARFFAAAKEAGIVRDRKSVNDTAVRPEASAEVTDSEESELGQTDDLSDETQGTLQEAAEASGVTPDGGDEFIEDRAAKALERSPHVQIIRGLIHFNLPSAQHNDQTAIELLVAESAALYGGSLTDPKSYASLFNPAAWNQKCLHPALVSDEAFSEWLDQSRQEDTLSLFSDLNIALRALGRQGAFEALDKMKGSYGREILTADVSLNNDGSLRDVGFSPRRQSLSAEVAESLLRTVRKDKVQEAIRLLESERTAGIAGRAQRLAKGTNMLFGENNWLGQKFGSEKVRRMIGPHVVSGAKQLKAGNAEHPDVTWYRWFGDYLGNGIGILPQRVLNAAKLIASGDNRMAVRELLRGDALSKATADATNRGGMAVFLNHAASLEPVTSATRRAGDGRVRGIDQDMSAGNINFLNSDAYKAAFVALNGKLGEEGIEFARRFGLWPDGTKVFATFAGLTRTISGAGRRTEVGKPSYEELVDLTNAHYDSGKDDVAYITLYNSEKTLERLIQIPRKGLAALTGKDSPSYADVTKVLSKLLGIMDVSPKRVAYYTAGGSAATLSKASVAILIPEDAAAAENLHGMGYIFNSDLAGYYRMQGFDSAAKVIITEAPGVGGRTLFAKGQFILADQADSGALPASQRDLFRIGAEQKLDYLSDMDSFKETVLYYKTVGAEAGRRTLLECVQNGVTDAEVKVPEGGTRPVSELVAENGISLVRETVNGRPVSVVKFITGLRSQTASAPCKKAKPKHNEIPINYLTDNRVMWKFARQQNAVRLAIARKERAEEYQKIVSSLTDSARALLDAGCDPKDPDLAKLIGVKLANAVTRAFDATMYGVQYLNRNFDGARVSERPDGSTYVSDPYGGMDALVHDAQDLTAGESARMNGAVRRLASTAANAGGATFRYGLRVNASAFGLPDTDHAGLMQAVEDRVVQLKAAERRSQDEKDLGVYLKAYTDLIPGCFSDYKGDDLPPGQLLSFSDLVEYKAGVPVFDRTRIGVRTVEGETFVFLGGQVQISGRTPSRDGHRAEYAHSVARPAYLQKADGSQYYTAVETDQDGNLQTRKVAYEPGTLVPGTDAVLLMTPYAKYIAGSDEDWDKSHSQRLPTDAYGREYAHVADVLEAIEGVDPADINKARALADTEIAAIEGDAFWAALRERREERNPMTNPVTATPFSAEYEKGNIPAVRRPPLDTPEGIGQVAYSNKEVAQKLRSISVRIVGDCLIAASVGMRFPRPVAGGASVLVKPEGAKSAFWDKGGFRVGHMATMSEDRLRTFINAATGIANSTFDDLKVALAQRAGFRPEHLDLYLYLGYESGVTTQGEYEEFHSAFMEWMNGKDGQAVSAAYRNGAYATRYGGEALAGELRRTVYQIEAAAAKEEGPVFRYRRFGMLSAPHKVMVSALANANGGGTSGFDASDAVVSTLLRLQYTSTIGDIITYKKVDMAFPDKARQARDKLLQASRIAEGPKAAAVFSGEGREEVMRSMGEFAGKLAAAEEALSGNPEKSEFYGALVSAVDRRVSESTGFMPPGDIALKVVNTRVPFDAAVMLTPEDTGLRIAAALDAVPPESRTAAFTAVTEELLSGLFRQYAISGGGVNAALDALIVPTDRNKADRITMTGSDNTAFSGADIRVGMEAMRDGTSGLGPVTVTVSGVKTEFTATDFYWMLLQYTLLTSGKAVDTGRGNQALLRAFYGDAVWKAVSDYQVSVLSGAVQPEAPAEELLSFVSIPGKVPAVSPRSARAFPLQAVPDVYRNTGKPWGTKVAPKEVTVTDTVWSRERPVPETVPEMPAAPAASETSEAQTFANIERQARSVAAAMRDSVRRRLPDYAFRGLTEAARHSAADEKAAADMAGSLLKAAALPWAAGVPAIMDNAKAAGEILSAMRFPEPTVFTGFVRASGRAAAASGNREAVDNMLSIYAAANASTTGDADRISGLRSDPALLSKPAVLRVMEFAVASEPKFKLTEESKTGTEAIAARILRQLDMEVTASRMDVSVFDAFSREAGRRASEHHKPYSAYWNDYIKRYSDHYRKYAVAAANAPDMPAALAAIEILRERGPALFKRLEAIIRDVYLSEESQYREYIREKYREASDAELASVLADPDAEANESPLADAAVGYTPERARQMEFAFGPVTDVSASMAEDKQMLADLKITEEELAAYAAQPGPFDVADDLQRKLQKRLEALIPPMPDEFETEHGVYTRTAAGSYGFHNFQENIIDPVSKETMEKAWASLNASKQTGDLALVAQAVEDWKRDNGIVYDPNDAYSRGEGFFHDIGAFNPSAPGLLGEVAKVLLAQEKKRRRGDLRYWEDTANQLVVSSYTSPAGLINKTFEAATSFVHKYDIGGVGGAHTFEKRNGQWFQENSKVAGGWELVPEHYAQTMWLLSESQVKAPVRPGEGLRFVIRPAAHQILWAAKGDVYSGTVERAETFDFDASMALQESSNVFIYGGVTYSRVADANETGDIVGWDYLKNGESSSREEFDAAKQAARDAIARHITFVDPKAPAAEKLSLLSPTVADAISERRPQNYNELGVRLALGNFYIEETTTPRKLSGTAVAFEKNGEWFVKDQFTNTTKAASKAAAEAEAAALNEELVGGLPKELRRLNKHLKRAFIRVHGSLDPVAPYEPKTINRAAGAITASRSDAVPALVDLIRQADAEVRKYDTDGYRNYVKEFYSQGQRSLNLKPESVAARMPLYLGNDASARRNIGDYIRSAADSLASAKDLGPAKLPMVLALNAFFKERRAQGGLADVASMTPKQYGQLMKTLGNLESGALRGLRELRASAAGMPENEKSALLERIEAAEQEFFSAFQLGRCAAAALRPTVRLDVGGVLKTLPNPLRTEILAVENEAVTPAAGVPPPAPASAEELVALDPDTGHPDPMDEVSVAFLDTDAWFYSTVFPTFRGASLRDTLFDKSVLAILPEINMLSNRFESYFGIDSEGGMRPITKAKGMGHYLSAGGFEYDDERRADVTVFGRRKLRKEVTDLASGNAFTDSEFELARWYGNTVYYAMGNGLKGVQQTPVGIRFDLKWDMKLDELLGMISVSEAERRLNNPSERMYGVHDTILRLKEVLPAEILPYAVEAIRDAVAAGHAASGSFDERGQAALRHLKSAGFADARTRREKDLNGETVESGLYDARVSVPVRVSEEVFLASSAAAKLEANGRDRADMGLAAASAPLRAGLDRLNSSVRALGWTVNGDCRLFSDVGTAAPFFKGTAAIRHYARKAGEPVTPEYRDAVRRAYESLAESFPRMREVTEGRQVWLSGRDAAGSAGFQRMFNYLKDLAPSVFGSADTPGEMWSKIENGNARGIGLSADSTAWDIARKVYELSVSRLHDSAWNGATLVPVTMDKAGLEAFNRMIGEAAAEYGDPDVTPGVSFSDIYDVTGALAQGLTAGEALALHSKQIAEMLRARGAMNQMLMAADEEGRPLVYARPGVNAADDTVPDRVWSQVARWWAETYAGPAGKEAVYDESRSGRENAAALYDLITPSLKGSGSVQEASRGVSRYVLTDVEIPAGLTTFSALSAMKDPAGDDTKARMNVFGGGEAANMVRQIMAVAGYGRESSRMVQVNRFLSWSKSASVMASLFFPIATAFESPIAAVGFWPTVFGVSETGSKLARWMKDNSGWLAKAAGVDDIAKAPFMADIMRVIGSDDPALVDLKVFAVSCGLNLADRAHNMMDTDRTTIANDINATVSMVRKTMGAPASKAARAILEGAMEHSSEFAFEYVINATKIAVFAQMTNRMRQKALAAGRWWDPVTDMKKWAGYINAEVGGIDTAMYPWMTPKMQQVLKAVMFSWEWTLGAWEAGGGGVLTQKWFGVTTPKHVRGFMFGRWLRMYGAVMIGLPFFMQLLITAFAKAAGAGDDDDKWLSMRNELGHAGKDFDITPLLRVMAQKPLLFIPGLPTLGDIKKRLPGTVLGLPVGNLIPALTGQEGESPTTRRRRYYMHLGKQGWEVAGWFEDPAKSFLSKMSMPAQRMLEGVLGITPAMGWEKPFADMGFWERWTSLDYEKSALLNLTGAVLPFSVMSMERAPEAGVISVIGPIGKGISQRRAEKEMAGMFAEWADSDSFAAMMKGRPGAWTDLKAMSFEHLLALKANGYDPMLTLKRAVTAARAPLYQKLHQAMPAFPEARADTRAMEEAARGLYRLNYIAKSLASSLRARDKAQNIRRTGEFRDITNRYVRDAFMNPYGPAGSVRDAVLGGDVRGLLATDEVPATMLGYRVVPQEQMTDSQKQYFADNPQAAGHFERQAKKGGI